MVSMFGLALLAWHGPATSRTGMHKHHPSMCSIATTKADIRALWSLPCTTDACIVGGPEEDNNGGLPRKLRKVSQFSTLHKLWTIEDWDQHTDPFRYLVLALTWYKSTILRSLWPVLVAYAVWCRIVWVFKLTVTPNALAYLASPLGLLLAFRVNTVVARFHEARLQWGLLIFHSRDLASTLAASSFHIPLATRLHCCRLLVAFSWAVKAATRPDDNLASVLTTLLAQEEAQAVASSRKPPTALLSSLRRVLLPLPLPPHAALAVQESVSELNRLYGGIERLLSTPLSPTYMRHALRGLFIWLIMLPAGLISSGCTSFAKLVVVATAVAYVMLGIDEIGVQIENPFDILPQHALAGALTRDVAEELLRPVAGDDVARI